jgi:CDP-paratose 2-epimerase
MRVLVTGGSGFIGTNVTEHFLSKGNDVTVFDNLSRPGGGAKVNADYLQEKYKNNPKLKFFNGDVRKIEDLKKVVKDIDLILHFAAQTTMTLSITNPVEDFEVNALGTFNLLEAVRTSESNPVIIYTSTNKVYGDLTRLKVELVEKETRWDFKDDKYFEGINESYPLDFEGPYGCSKGTGDVYCLDYSRTFGMKNVVFRMSGIYGPSQRPIEDQGWVAWIIKCGIEKKPMTIYGDGKQVRDILYIEDLLRAFDLAFEKVNITKGQSYNIGGGRSNSISLIELLDFMKNELNIEPSKISYDKWRRADQKVYISNTAKANREFGWKPEVSMKVGMTRLFNWLKGVV